MMASVEFALATGEGTANVNDAVGVFVDALQKLYRGDDGLWERAPSVLSMGDLLIEEIWEPRLADKEGVAIEVEAGEFCLFTFLVGLRRFLVVSMGARVEDMMEI